VLHQYNNMIACFGLGLSINWVFWHGRRYALHVWGVRQNTIAHFRGRYFVLLKTYTLRIYHRNILLKENKYNKCFIVVSQKGSNLRLKCARIRLAAGLRASARTRLRSLSAPQTPLAAMRSLLLKGEGREGGEGRKGKRGIEKRGREDGKWRGGEGSLRLNRASIVD